MTSEALAVWACIQEHSSLFGKSALPMPIIKVKWTQSVWLPFSSLNLLLCPLQPTSKVVLSR